MSFSDYEEHVLAPRRRQYHEFLRSPQWRAACARVRERFHNLCLFCKTSENLEVHHGIHLLPNRDDAPPDLPCGWLPAADAGLILLCHDCHFAWHRFWRTGRRG
jgi:hypothetical protein